MSRPFFRHRRSFHAVRGGCHVLDCRTSDTSMPRPHIALLQPIVVLRAWSPSSWQAWSLPISRSPSATLQYLAQARTLLILLQRRFAPIAIFDRRQHALLL